MSQLPATVANLDVATVREALARHDCNVSDAAADLRVPASDLRRLLWSNPQLQDEVFEVVEARLDKAEKNIVEALESDDSRRRDAASFFVLRNTARARGRGWITASTSVAEFSISASASANGPRTITYRWRTDEDDERDADAAERERLRDADKLIENEVRKEPRSKDKD